MNPNIWIVYLFWLNSTIPILAIRTIIEKPDILNAQTLMNQSPSKALTRFFNFGFDLFIVYEFIIIMSKKTCFFTENTPKAIRFCVRDFSLIVFRISIWIIQLLHVDCFSRDNASMIPNLQDIVIKPHRVQFLVN